jgi:hypothetical protein
MLIYEEEFPVSSAASRGMTIEEARDLIKIPIEQINMLMENPGWRHYVYACHDVLHHMGIPGGCEGHRMQLAGFLSQMFHCGWLAGRQEIIDEFVKGQK